MPVFLTHAHMRYDFKANYIVRAKKRAPTSKKSRGWLQPLKAWGKVQQISEKHLQL